MKINIVVLKTSCKLVIRVVSINKYVLLVFEERKIYFNLEEEYCFFLLMYLKFICFGCLISI